jgi:glycosyltransferase involved in cell wall biosynthesis
MDVIMLSIITPTYNEEKYLPLLLESLKQQDFKDYEIIIADNNSKDRTGEIAKRYGCRIVPGGLPARGRNSGAKAAKGEMLLFLDADIVLPKGFLKKSLSEFWRRNLNIASYSIVPKTTKQIIKRGFDVFYNWPASLSQNFLPHGDGYPGGKRNIPEGGRIQ